MANENALKTSIRRRVQAVAIGAVAIACAAVPGCSEHTPARGEGNEGPHIRFERLGHDFGIISDAEPQRARFRFTNTGNATLRVEDVKASCRCAGADRRAFEVLPGDSDQIDLVFDPAGKSDKTNLSVTVISNCRENPTITLGLTSDVAPLLRCPHLHNLGTLELGEGKRTHVELRYADPDLDFVEVSVLDNAGRVPFITARFTEIGVIGTPPDGTYRAHLEIAVDEAAPWGSFFATRVHLAVRGRPWPGSDPVEHEYDMYLTGRVFGQLRASRELISLTAEGGGEPIGGSVEITRIGEQPFTITSARITDSTWPGFQARIERVNAWTCRVHVEGPTGDLGGTVHGVVTIRTDVPGEEHLEMRFVGQVTSPR